MNFLEGLLDAIGEMMLSDEDKLKLINEGKPERMTALLLRTDADDERDTLLSLLKVSPSWGHHGCVIVVQDTTDLPTESAGPDGDMRMLRPEIVGKRRTSVIPAHLYLHDGEWGAELCPIGHDAMKLNERTHSDGIPPLAEVLAEFGIELVDSEDDMLADEKGVEA